MNGRLPAESAPKQSYIVNGRHSWRENMGGEGFDGKGEVREHRQISSGTATSNTTTDVLDRGTAVADGRQQLDKQIPRSQNSRNQRNEDEKSHHE